MKIVLLNAEWTFSDMLVNCITKFDEVFVLYVYFSSLKEITLNTQLSCSHTHLKVLVINYNYYSYQKLRNITVLVHQLTLSNLIKCLRNLRIKEMT